MIQINKKKKRLEINMTAFQMGKDLCVILTGGHTPHLGAVTVGSQAKVLQTFAFEQHKENIVTEIFGNILRREFGGSFAICCGIHLDNISSEEITDSIEFCREIAEELCCLLKKCEGIICELI